MSAGEVCTGEVGAGVKGGEEAGTGDIGPGETVEREEWVDDILETGR